MIFKGSGRWPGKETPPNNAVGWEGGENEEALGRGDFDLHLGGVIAVAGEKWGNRRLKGENITGWHKSRLWKKMSS